MVEIMYLLLTVYKKYQEFFTLGVDRVGKFAYHMHHNEAVES